MSECPKCGGPPVEARSGYDTTLVGYAQCKVDPTRHHDDNCIHKSFRCSAGHVFSLSRVRRCGDDVPGQGPACDWTGRRDCQICGDVLKPDDWPDVPEVPYEDWRKRVT